MSGKGEELKSRLFRFEDASGGVSCNFQRLTIPNRTELDYWSVVIREGRGPLNVKVDGLHSDVVDTNPLLRFHFILNVIVILVINSINT